MKRLTLLLVLTVLSYQITYGQELKNVKKREKTFREEYAVLASDKKIKHGDYKRYSMTDQLTIEGKYENNQKVGEWKFFVDGELEQTFDYSAQQMKFHKTMEEPYIVDVNGTEKLLILDTPPTYLGAKVRLHDELNSVMTYPMQARRMGVEGVVIASVWINPDGTIETKIVRGIMKECDAELLKGLSKVEKDWVPGTLQGATVKSQYFVELEYKLDFKSGSVYMTVR
ncbi:energy transducer TonB [Pseudochryseolinea flava]|uniref:TonB C-terminal domain-containing protein n=1 Tax=Pseudochryseolinea flava TaxID=2059302 RepID=A0A364Y3V4_9BACT|nr:energy transducer TonB [Pseudochryseolinea flava]RAW01382.1 hypothetical protein DQQ10_10800 [Pseudochryseolinea flava]